LGRHQVVAFVGAGGMGEVYRARDTELGRDVALKVLRPERVADAGARRRLIQEARTASALNHPHITTVHDVVEADGLQCIVMEFVAGRPLSAVIRAGLGLDEALRIAIAIADGLERAHAAGVIHRDLKPANVVISDEGVAKVLDFGIAKLVEQGASAAEDATQTEAASAAPRPAVSGVVGTPGYMAPEQATGGTLDARSDIFSFGALLYEMLTGKRAFSGATAAETVGAVLALQPVAPRQLVPELPAALEQAVMRCLRKEPERRFQSMADLAVVLRDIAEARATSARPRAAGPLGAWRLELVAGLAAALIAAGGVTALVVSWPRDGDEPPGAARLEPLTTVPGIEASPTFSADGRQFVYAFDPEPLSDDGRPNFDLWVRLVGGPDARRLTSDDTDELAPSWSPDGRWIAYQRGRVGDTPAVYVISPLGGVSRPVTSIRAARIETGWLRGAPASQIAWTRDSGSVIFARAGGTGSDTGGLQLASVQGGASRVLTSTSLPVVHRDPALSPDGQRLAYSACAGAMYAPCDVYVLELDADLTPEPPARRLTQQDLTIVGLAWTRDGRDIVFGGARFDRTHLWRVPADGSAPPSRIEIGRRGMSPAIAASGDRLAFVYNVYDTDIHAFESARPDRVVASSTLIDHGPSYGPAGRFAFESSRSGDGNEIWIMNDDGSDPIQLTHGPGGWQGTPAWSPDGARIAFDSRGADGFAHVWLIRPDGLDLQRVTHGALSEAMPSWSRDGRWLYYREDRNDGCDLWRIPIEGGAPEQVTVGGGFRGVEAPDGRTLVFAVSDDESPLFAQAVTGGPRRQVVRCAITRSLAAGPDGVYYMACPAQAPTSQIQRLDLETGTELQLGTAAIGGGFVPGMSVSPDGKRILFTKRVAEGADLMLVEHFR
jgi:Tol biopolymer transport system component/tRNA A-37 threonylcarbamoyl transferase component Bud32